MKKVMIFAIALLTSCCSQHKYKKLSVKDIEIYRNTPAWDLANALDDLKLNKARKILAREGKDLVNYQDPIFETTLLMRAISKENYEATTFLLENGADVNIISFKTGTTALFEAISHSWEDVTANEDPRFVKILLENGANPNTPYYAPKMKGATSLIEYGTSPLMYATLMGFEKVKLLVNFGADINYKTELGTTASTDALLMEEVEVAHYLIVEKKAKVSEPFYFYHLGGPDRAINYDKPHWPISLLEDWLFPLDSKKHILKMEIVKEFKRQGHDYWSISKHPKTIERIKKRHPNDWQNYLEKY